MMGKMGGGGGLLLRERIAKRTFDCYAVHQRLVPDGLLGDCRHYDRILTNFTTGSRFLSFPPVQNMMAVNQKYTGS